MKNKTIFDIGGYNYKIVFYICVVILILSFLKFFGDEYNKNKDQEKSCIGYIYRIGNNGEIINSYPPTNNLKQDYIKSITFITTSTLPFNKYFLASSSARSKEVKE